MTAREMGNPFGNPLGLPRASGTPSIGDITLRSNDPGPGYLKADGGDYLQADFPGLYAKIGQQAPMNKNPPQPVFSFPNSLTFNYVVGGNGICVCITSGSNVSYVSVDRGVTWKSSAPVVFSNGVSALVFANGVFFAFGTSSSSDMLSNKYYTSLDGLTWVARFLPVAGVWRNVFYLNGTYLVTGLGDKCFTSANGFDVWVQRSLPGTGFWSEGVVYGGVMVLLQIGTQQIAVSNDMVNWQSKIIPGANWHTICASGSLVVIASSLASVTAVSSDGISYSLGSLGAESSVKFMTYGDGMFFALPGLNSRPALCSLDGYDWRPTPPWYHDFGWAGLIYINNAFIGTANGFNGVIWPRYSYDSATSFAVPYIPVNGLTAYIRAK